ncbi:MAG: AbrB/MazE/SpoVT family DNA-binding domain-containing protein [Alphaproteobacteria bacterium]|nr:AbrB/MazE/SpoVT family DNA-binding domain-containing protein [Candidatus Jidaibacter sp.]
MTEIRTHVDNNGRILIPAQIRKECNIKRGDVFVLRTIDGEIRMVSLKKVIADARALIRKHTTEGVSLVGEFLQIRREEAALEEKKMNEYSNNEGTE